MRILAIALLAILLFSASVSADEMPPLQLDLRLPLVIKEQTPLEPPPCVCPPESKECVCAVR